MLRNSLVVILLFFSSIIYSQSILVSGIVVDEGGNPLPGVTVLIEGTNRGTSSTFEGTYAIKADNENQNIQFSYISFEMLLASSISFTRIYNALISFRSCLCYFREAVSAHAAR